MAAGRFAAGRRELDARVELDRVELLGFFRALGDRVLVPLRVPPAPLPDRAVVVLELREPVGEDVRVAMGTT